MQFCVCPPPHPAFSQRAPAVSGWGFLLPLRSVSDQPPMPLALVSDGEPKAWQWERTWS